MSGIWMGGLEPSAGQSQELAHAREHAASMRRSVKDLEHHVARLSLMNQALWELIRERLRLDDADLEQKAREVDLRDGVEDGCISDVALKCPNCGRVSNSKHWKCLYCGQRFEKPVMG